MTTLIATPTPTSDPPADEQFYAAFTARSRGRVSESEQQLLRRAVILVARCGSIGGTVVDPLVRTGAGGWC